MRPIIFAIDVEPDDRKTDGAGRGWEGSRDALGHLEEFRSRLETRMRRPVQLNWFIRTDPQIRITWGAADYVAFACPELLQSIDQHGDYAGTHLHLWRWNQKLGVWFNDFRDRDWLTECFETSVEGFKRIFGNPPEACRFGDRWLNQAAVDMMRARGIRYDLTIEPGLPAERLQDDPLATDPLPDFRRAPRKPYRPHTADFLLPHPRPGAADSLWMIPLTTSQPFWAIGGNWPFARRLSRTPNLVTPPELLWPWMSAYLDRPGVDPLVMVIRSGDLSNPECLHNFVETIGRLEVHPEIGRCEFTSPAVTVGRLEAQLSARGAAASS